MLPQVLEDAFSTGEVRRADGLHVPMNANVSREEATRLYNLVRELRPAVVIELGLAQGVSALAISQAIKDNACGAVHYVVDPFQTSGWDRIGLANLDRAHLADHVRFFEAFPEAVLPTLPRADFAFIDASHLFDLTILDFVLVDKRLKVGGLMGFHDLWMESLRKVLRYILTNRNYRIYHDVEPSETSARTLRKLRVLSLAHRVVHVERLFNPEVLQPPEALGIQRNMVFIEKTGEDERDWRFHAQF